jgi:glycerophosphoryl diester phosphodiesterase
MEDKLLEVLAKYDLTGPDSPVIIQSFETANLQYLRKKTRIRLVQLIDADDVAADGSLTYVAPYDKPYNFAVTGDPRGFADLVAPRGLADIAKYADGIGPWKRYIVSVRTLPDRTTQTITATNLIQRAHELGLFVHAYTFRNEPGTLAGSYNGNPRLEYMQFYLLGVDGVFSDFPDTAIEARRTTEPMIPR